MPAKLFKIACLDTHKNIVFTVEPYGWNLDELQKQYSFQKVEPDTSYHDLTVGLSKKEFKDDYDKHLVFALQKATEMQKFVGYSYLFRVNSEMKILEFAIKDDLTETFRLYIYEYETGLD